MSVKKTKIEEMAEEENEHLNESDEKLLIEINYSKKQLKADLEQLKQWLKEQHHLPECRLKESDNFLAMYLTGCKGSLETVKRKLDAYYSLRGKSIVYRNRDTLDEDYRNTCDKSIICIIPRTTKDNGELIMAFKLADQTNPILMPTTFTNAMKRLINIIEIAMRLRNINKNVIGVVDFKGYTPAHAVIFSPSLLKDTLYIVQNVFPTRIKRIIAFNVPVYFEVVINTAIKPFLKQKLRDRLIITSAGCEELHKYIDKAVLPPDWQGDYSYTLREIGDAWNDYEIIHRDWFINELSEETDESRRVSTDMKYLEIDSYFGVQGTLKKLVVD